VLGVSVGVSVATGIGAGLDIAGGLATVATAVYVAVISTGGGEFSFSHARRVKTIMNRSHERTVFVRVLVGATADSPSWIVIGVEGQQNAADAQAIFSHPYVQDSVQQR
jgi:hypothetical protein